MTGKGTRRDKKILNEGHDAFRFEIDTPQLMDGPCSTNLVLSSFCSLHDTAP